MIFKKNVLRLFLLCLVSALLTVAPRAIGQDYTDNDAASEQLCPIIETASELGTQSGSQRRVNDPLYQPQWHLSEEEGNGWERILPYEPYHQFGRGVVVAVVDDGVDFHDDLSPSLFTPGYDAIESKDINSAAGSTSYNSHGTRVAGVIAQATCNGQGAAGIAPNVKIMPIKVAKHSQDIDIEAIALGIEKAIEKGAHVINISLDFKALSKEAETNLFSNSNTVRAVNRLKAAIMTAYRKDIVVVMAAGNYASGDRIPKFAIDLLESRAVITVAAHDRNGQLSSYSTQIRGVDLVAPGGESDNCSPQPIVNWNQDKSNGIITTEESAETGDLDVVNCSGTSFAAPQVSGTAALEISQIMNVRNWPDSKFSSLDGLWREHCGDVCTENSDRASAYSVQDIRKILEEPHSVIYQAHRGDWIYDGYDTVLQNKFVQTSSGKIPKLDLYASDFAAYEFAYHSLELFSETTLDSQPDSLEQSNTMLSEFSSPMSWSLLAAGGISAAMLIYALKLKKKKNNTSDI